MSALEEALVTVAEVSGGRQGFDLHHWDFANRTVDAASELAAQIAAHGIPWLIAIVLATDYARATALCAAGESACACHVHVQTILAICAPED